MTLLTYTIFLNVGLKSLAMIFWFKVLTSIMAIIINQKIMAKEIFFYMNIGIGKKELTIFALIIDFTIWVLGIIILIKN